MILFNFLIFLLDSSVAILYLLTCFFFGVQLIRFLLPDHKRLFVGISPNKNILRIAPGILFYYPAGMVVGLMVVTIFTYIFACIMTPFMPNEMHVLYPANIVSLCLFLYLGSFFWQKNFYRRHPDLVKQKEEKPESDDMSAHRKKEKTASIVPVELEGFTRSRVSIILYSIATLFFFVICSLLIYYSFYVKNGYSYAGYSVFSDLAPHTAIVSSFSNGLNFPTQYPHFPDGTIRYHFLFFFLCGNLNFLGMRIDHALNIPSIICMVCMFMLLGLLAVLLSGRRLAYLLAPLLVLFRSSYAIVSQIKDLAAIPQSNLHSIIHGILTNTVYIGHTLRDDWGLWAINVYANQRHIMLGISLMLILIMLFIPYVRRMWLHVQKKGLLSLFASRAAWIPIKGDPLHPISLLILSVLIIICMPFFHGSALIGVLLILFIMAIFSENRLSYLVVALAGILSSWIQTNIFSGGSKNVVTFDRYFGFLLEDSGLTVNFKNICKYIFSIEGLAAIIFVLLMIGLLIYEIIRKRNIYRFFLLLAFTAPAVFAFVCKVSLDITTNHKFVLFTFILATIPVAAFLSMLVSPFTPKFLQEPPAEETEEAQSIPKPPRKALRMTTRIVSSLVAACLLIPLTATGVSDWITYYNLNKNDVLMNIDSPIVEWVEEKTAPNDIFLTASWSMNTFFLSGRPIYFGHPYYAWSAGYDTESRNDLYHYLLTGCDSDYYPLKLVGGTGDISETLRDGDLETFLTICHDENIKYILIDNDLRYQQNEIASGLYFTLNEAFFTENFDVLVSFPNENNTVIYKIP